MVIVCIFYLLLRDDNGLKISQRQFNNSLQIDIKQTCYSKVYSLYVT